MKQELRRRLGGGSSSVNTAIPAGQRVDENASPAATVRARIPTAIAVCGSLILVLTFWFGTRLHMDTVMPSPTETRAQQLGAALSEHIYHLGLGGGAHRAILNSLHQDGFTVFPNQLAELGLIYPNNMRDHQLINKALERASRLGGITSDISLSEKSMYLLSPEDLGMVDFMRVSFSLFGLNVQGLYYTYFIFLSIGFAAFSAGHWYRPAALSFGNLFLLGHFIAVAYAGLDVAKTMDFELASVNNGRFMSVLGILPTYHIFLTIMDQPARRLRSVVPFVIQVALLLFVFSIRSTIQWAILAIVIVIMARLLVTVVKGWSESSMMTVYQRGIGWPVVVITLCFVVFQIQLGARINSLYSVLDETLLGHLTWHNVYYGLPYHEEWGPRFANRHQNKSGDALAFRGAEVWLEDHGLPIDYMNAKPPMDDLRYKTYERIMRQAFFDFVKANPEYWLKMTIVNKPRAVVAWFNTQVLPLFSHIPLQLLAVAGLVGAGLFAGRRELVRDGKVLRATALYFALALPLVSLPVVLAYPTPHAMADQAYVYPTVLLGLLLLLAISPFARLRFSP